MYVDTLLRRFAVKAQAADGCPHPVTVFVYSFFVFVNIINPRDLVAEVQLNAAGGRLVNVMQLEVASEGIRSGGRFS